MVEFQLQFIAFCKAISKLFVKGEFNLDRERSLSNDYLLCNADFRTENGRTLFKLEDMSLRSKFIRKQAFNFFLWFFSPKKLIKLLQKFAQFLLILKIIAYQ